MSGEDFIYSAITNDNMNAFDLNVIASTLASTDKLVRQHKQQKEENDLLREKISSLHESALQIKTLYETEAAKAARAEAQLASYVSQCKQLEERCLEADSDKINADLILMERLAENDRQHEEKERRYQSLITDLIRYFSTPGPDTADCGKKRDLKHHLPALDVLNLPDDVKAFIQQAPFHRSKRRKERARSAVLKDQECQTVRVEMRNSSNNTDPLLPTLRPEVRDCGTDAPDEEQQQQPKEQPASKTFCDKATMHSMSTITRATCTSVFIKRVDVGVNFPEVTLKSVDEILRECVPLPPLLLTPITDILPLYESVGTQTDQPAGPNVEKPALVTCGTMTNLKNIRKRIDYRTVEQQYATSMAEQLFGKIKQEDFSAPGFGFEPHDTFGSMHPHLSTIWRLLGESIFMLMSSGRRFDNQCYNMLNEQLTTIRDMLEADGRRESELMSTMFSNVRATVVAAAGYGKDRGTTAPVVANVVLPDSGGGGPASVTDDCDDGRVMEVEKEIETVRAVSATKEISNSEDAAVVVLVEPESRSPERQITPNVSSGSKIDAVAQSIETKDTEAVSKTSSDEKQQTGAISPVTSPSTSADVEEPSLVLDDEEVDRIEQQLQMMEEGEPELSTLVESRNQALETDDDVQLEENELNVAIVPKPETAAATKQLPPSRPSTPPQVLCVSSCYPPASTTATFVSPIKVKETNQLVKDQFKTPTQPPIGKRKLRVRRADEPPQLPQASKRMRFDSQSNNGGSSSGGRPASPTTEFLLEDDWDEKFSSIMAHMVGPLKESGERRPLSPITDRYEEFVVELMERERDKEDGSCAVAERQETAPTVQSGTEEERIRPVESVTPTIERIEEASDFTAVEVKDGKVCEESKSSQVVADIAPIERRLSGESKDEDISSECNLTIERKLPEETNTEQEATLPTAVETVVEIPDTSVNMDTSDKDECTPAALEDEQISEELNESFTSIGELVIDIDPPLSNDEDSEPSSTVWDSPMSPPAHETGSLAVSVPSPTRPIACTTDSPLSPPLPSDRGLPASTTKPPRIPLFHVALHSQLRQQVEERKEPIYTFIARHKAKNGHESTHRLTGRFNAQEQQLLQQLSNILTLYLQRPDWTETVVNETITAVLNCTQDVYLMSIALVELVVSCGDITVNVLCSPPAPPLPLVQQKLILIVRHLGYGLDALEQALMRELDRRMFQLKGDPLPLTGLIALTYLYIGLEDSKPSETPWKREYNVRLYMFKCLYYFGYKGLPLVYYVLRAFPFALPKQGSPHYDNSDAMIATLRTILMNANYTVSTNVNYSVGSSESALYRKRELLRLLRNTYGYEQGSPTYEELVVNLVEKIRANKLRNVAHSLILVAKRNGFDWARLHIIQKRIYPLLNDYLKQFELRRAASSSASSACSTNDPATGGTLDERIVTCIFTIASIMKTQPSNEDASRVMQIFTTIVQLSEGNRAIQEEAIAGLIKFSRFGFVDIFQRLSSWNPDYPISDRIKLMLTTMVHRKPPLFWKQLLQNRIVDIDEKILQQCRTLVRPLLNDYLSPSAKPLTVEVWRGNIAEPHVCLEGTDVVIGIEIIEHLHQPILDKVPENVFGFIKPKVAFFSTPNADYNVLFDGLLENGFRHHDHKFEWTRVEFEAWAESICQRYPDYCVKYFGIGPAPVGSESVGCVSQMAVFVRRDFLDTLSQPVESPVTEEEERSVPAESIEVEQRSTGDGVVPARPNAIYLEENGEIILVQPSTDEAASESQAGGEPAGGPFVADDIVAEERYREFNDVFDDLDDGDDDCYGGYGDNDEDNDEMNDSYMIDMYIPEEDAHELRTRNDSGNFEEEDLIEPGREYWLITAEVYPVAAPDNRSHEQHIQDAAEYQLRRMRNFGDDFLAPEQDRYLIPLRTVHECMNMELASVAEVRQALVRAGYNIGADDIVVLPLEDEDDNDDDSDEDRLYDDGDYDDRYPAWDDSEEAKASQGVRAMTLEDCDETWD